MLKNIEEVFKRRFPFATGEQVKFITKTGHLLFEGTIISTNGNEITVETTDGRKIPLHYIIGSRFNTTE